MVKYGPMQLLVIGFPGNEFSGEIVPAINDVREKGLIRLIDYAFVGKADDSVNMLTVEDINLGPAEVKPLGSVVGGLIGIGAGGRKGAKVFTDLGMEVANERTYGLVQNDIDEIIDSIPNNSSCLFAIIEHLWAKDIKQAVVDSNGIVFIQGMLPPELFVSAGEVIPKPVGR